MIVCIFIYATLAYEKIGDDVNVTNRNTTATQPTFNINGTCDTHQGFKQLTHTNTQTSIITGERQNHNNFQNTKHIELHTDYDIGYESFGLIVSVSDGQR